MVEKSEPILILATFGTRANAEDTARRIIKRRLGACVNLLPSVTSFYEWEGALQEDEELVMLVKSGSAQQEALISLIVEGHDYDEPAVMVVPVNGGAAGFLKWAADQVGSGG